MTIVSKEVLRRQRQGGIVLILLALFVVGQAIYFNVEDRSQRECFQRRFSELSSATRIRAELNARETAATRAVLDVLAETTLGAEQPFGKVTKREARRARRTLVEATVAYQAATDAIQIERKRNPLPPFPEGTCEGVD